MARQTRQQRRARRAQQEPALAGGPPPRPPARPVENANVEPQPERKRSGGPEKERHVPGSGTVRFVQESYAELKKVEWPGQNQVIQGTVVVLIACAVVGIYLYLNDQVWKEVVSRLLLGQ